MSFCRLCNYIFCNFYILYFVLYILCYLSYVIICFVIIYFATIYFVIISYVTEPYIKYYRAETCRIQYNSLVYTFFFLGDFYLQYAKSFLHQLHVCNSKLLTCCWHAVDMLLTCCWHAVDMLLTCCWHAVLPKKSCTLARSGFVVVFILAVSCHSFHLASREEISLVTIDVSCFITSLSRRNWGTHRTRLDRSLFTRGPSSPSFIRRLFRLKHISFT